MDRDQLDLFDAGPRGEKARARHPDEYPRSLYGGTPPHAASMPTSRGAAESIRKDATRMAREILDHLHARGPEGATCDEVEVLLDMRHQTASGRIRELVLLGWARDSGRTRRTRAGRSAVVWVAKPGAGEAPEAAPGGH